MWKCIKCGEDIEDTFDVCWNCGTSKDGVEDPNFQSKIDAAPSSEGRTAQDGWNLADFALGVGQTCAFLGCIAAVVCAFLLLSQGYYVYGMVLAPISFFYQVAMFVVFSRVKNM